MPETQIVSQNLVDSIAEEVFSYWKHMPGYDEDGFPTYGTIRALVRQGIEKAGERNEHNSQ